MPDCRSFDGASFHAAYFKRQSHRPITVTGRLNIRAGILPDQSFLRKNRHGKKQNQTNPKNVVFM